MGTSNSILKNMETYLERDRCYPLSEVMKNMKYAAAPI